MVDRTLGGPQLAPLMSSPDRSVHLGNRTRNWLIPGAIRSSHGLSPGFLVLALAVGLGMAGCRVADEATAPPPAATSATVTSDRTPAAEPVPTVSTPEPSPGIASHEQQVSLRPEQILGMTRAEIDELFGMPTFVRHEPPAEFRRYRTPDCLAELYFYLRNNVHVLDHVEFRSLRGGSSDADCLASVLGARNGAVREGLNRRSFDISVR